MGTDCRSEKSTPTPLVTEFLDTNIIVRYLTGDPPAMMRRARQIIDTERTLHLTDAVLAETFYVIVSYYEVPREVAIDQLVTFLRRRNIETYPVDKGLAIEALLLCRPSARVSMVDALLWATARGAPEPIVHTLDERFPPDGIEVRIPPKA
jgi:predicted nucleic acid-binding protein